MQVLGNAMRIPPSSSMDFQANLEDLQFQAVLARCPMISWNIAKFLFTPATFSGEII